MALVARLIRGYVICGFDGGTLHTAARRMAGFAFLRRAFEAALDMAGFAGKCHMRAGQRKAGFDVVKLHVAFCLGGRRITVRQRKQDKAQYRKGTHPGRQSPETIS
ncbi:MAG: hypothetical protein Tsb0026_16720 [Sulfuricaulis sp.]